MRGSLGRVERRLRELMLGKSGAERLALGCAMFDDARTIVEAGLRAEHPGVSDAELRQLILLRLYARDLPAPWLAKAAGALRSSGRGR